MVLLTEMITPQRKPLIAESDQNGGGFWYLKGLFIEGDVRNHNGRIYPLSEISRAVQELNEKIGSTGPVVGELDHPEGLSINLDRVSHAITEMTLANANGVGRMRIMPEGLGRIVEGMIKIGVQLGVSSRGSGEVSSDGRVSNFSIKTVDIVADPSAPHALPQAIRESRLGRETLYLAEALKYDRNAQKFYAKAFRDYLMEQRDKLVWGR